MLTKLRLTVTALTIGLGFVAQQATAADQVTARVDTTQPGTLVVSSNGESYTKLKTSGNVRLNGTLVILTGGVSRKIKKWEAWPVFEYHTGSTQKLSGHYWYSVTETFSKGNRPGSVAEKPVFQVPAQFLNDAAVATCNARAATLRNSGKSNAQIFGQHQTAEMVMHVDVKFEATGLTHKIIKEEESRDLPIRCAKFTGPATPQATHVRPSDPAVPVVQAPNQSGSASGRTGRSTSLRLKANR